jgi:nitrous oxidase accessory protein
MRKVRVLLAIWGLVLVLTLVSTSSVRTAPPPDTFYVSPSGVDALERDGSASEPWRHVNYALGRSAVGGGDIIVVMSDGIDGNDDYVENVTVTKSVKIRGDASNPSKPVVKAADPALDVFRVEANGVEITGLGIHDSDTHAAILLSEVTGCLIQDNSLGFSVPAKGSCYGIRVVGGSQNIIRSNAAANNIHGIKLYDTSANVVYDNTLEMNMYGVYLHGTCSANLIINNTIRWCTSEGSSGVGLPFEGWEVRQNVISGNTIEDGDTGMNLGRSRDAIIASNRITGNTCGLNVSLFAERNDIFHNDFINDSNVESSLVDYTLDPAAPVFYRFSNRYLKLLMGNYYSDYAGSDADGNGLGDTPYDSDRYHDNQPLTQEIASYRLHGWNLGLGDGDVVILDDDLGGPGKIITLPAHSRVVCSSRCLTDAAAFFTGGSSTAQTTWNGWLTFASPPAAGQTVVVTFGMSDGSAPTFQSRGTSANVTGNGSDYIISLVADPGTLLVPKDKCLAVQLENTSDTALQLMVGGAAGMFFAPVGSHQGIPMQPLFLLLLE